MCVCVCVCVCVCRDGVVVQGGMLCKHVDTGMYTVMWSRAFLFEGAKSMDKC